MKRLYIRIVTVALSVTLVAVAGMGVIPRPASAVSGSDWRAGRIIDDGIFYNKNSMSVDQIQQFLNAKVPTCDTWGTQPYAGTTRAAYSASRGVNTPFICLKDYQENPTTKQNNLGGSVPAGAISAAQIIWNAAQQYNINPQVLIVMLQKEQALVQDDWPWPIQYQGAMGYGCPDTAACDSQYYGFYNQVMNAARQFRLYASNPNNYNFVPGNGNNIRYNPNASCGSSPVTIENQATASLYNYTPYQPNQAALNNLYGTGDGCSAYGNRNFWRMFNDWFGPTIGDGFILAKSEDPNDLRQWVIYGNIKQHVPDAQTLYAWGLQNQPLITVSGAALGSIPDGPNLDRLMRRQGDSNLYFVDNGKKYRVPWQSLFDMWNFGGVTISSVSADLASLPQDGGILSSSVKDPGSSAIYMLDGSSGGQTALRQYQSNDVRQALFGANAPYVTISSDYWDKINNAIGSTLTSTKISCGGTDYEVASGLRYVLPASIAPLFPGSPQSVSFAACGYLSPGGTASYLVREDPHPYVYLIDGGVRHYVPNASLFSAWAAEGYDSPMVVNEAFIRLISDGGQMNAYMAESDEQLYLVNRSKMRVPSGLEAAYRNAASVYSASSTLVDLFKTASESATEFVRSINAAPLYLLDNSGKRRHIVQPERVDSWGAHQVGITVLPHYIVDSFGTGAELGIYVSDGANEYVMDGGKKLTVSSGVKSDWNLSGPQTYTDGTLSRYSSGGSLANKARSNEGYFVIKGGTAYGTVDFGIAKAWGAENASAYGRATLGLVGGQMLTRFVRSPADNNQTFVVDNNHWYRLPAVQFSNVVGGQPVMLFDPAWVSASPTDWNYPLAKDVRGDYYAIDNNGRRYFPSRMIQDHWTDYGRLNVPTMSDEFLASLTLRGIVERTVKGGAPSMYSAPNGTKRHILYPDTYHKYYAPFIQVGDSLINALATGDPIP